MVIPIYGLDEKSDEELIAISNGRIPFGMVSGKSTTTPEDIIIQAKIILYNRQRTALEQKEKETLKIAKASLHWGEIAARWSKIAGVAAIIAIIATIALSLFSIFQTNKP